MPQDVEFVRLPYNVLIILVFHIILFKTSIIVGVLC